MLETHIITWIKIVFYYVIFWIIFKYTIYEYYYKCYDSIPSIEDCIYNNDYDASDFTFLIRVNFDEIR